MKRLLNSSNFWNAVICTILCVAAFKLTNSELIATGIFSMFGLRTLATGGVDFVNANKKNEKSSTSADSVPIDWVQSQEESNRKYRGKRGNRDSN